MRIFELAMFDYQRAMDNIDILGMVGFLCMIVNNDGNNKILGTQYPLALRYIAIEHGHRNSEFSRFPAKNGDFP